MFPEDDLPRDAGSINPWFAVVDRTPDAVVYRVRRRRGRERMRLFARVVGFGGLEPEGRFRARWLQRTRGMVLFVSGKTHP